MNILLIEDNLSIIKGIKYNLEQNNYQVVAKTNMSDSINYLNSNNKIDLIILDVTLPDGNGFNLYENNIKDLNIPTIILTAVDDEDNVVKGLELGVNEYITKPFSTKELVLRVNKIIQRTYRQDNTRIHIDGYEIDESQRMVYDKGQQVELTTKEFDLLMLFVKNKGTAFLREQILEQVWDTNYFGSDRVVDDTLRRLRKKMPNLSIHTIYGFGYRLG